MDDRIIFGDSEIFVIVVGIIVLSVIVLFHTEIAGGRWECVEWSEPVTRCAIKLGTTGCLDVNGIYECHEAGDIIYIEKCTFPQGCLKQAFVRDAPKGD